MKIRKFKKEKNIWNCLLGLLSLPFPPGEATRDFYCPKEGFSFSLVALSTLSLFSKHGYSN